MRFEDLVQRFRGPALSDRKGGVLVFCPSHGDGQKSGRQSLHLSRGPAGQTLVHCFAGCHTDAVLAAVGATVRDLMPEPTSLPPPSRTVARTYHHDYRDKQGQLVYQVIRTEFSDGSKTFKQRRPDPEHPGDWLWNLEGVPRILYRLPEVLTRATASPLGRGWLLLVEGDKLVDRLWALGIPATTNSGGAGKWDAAFFDQLGARVYGLILCPDHDQPGERHMRDVLRLGLVHGGLQYRWLDLPGLGPKEDVGDWLDRGGTREQLLELARAAPELTAPLPDVTPIDPAPPLVSDNGARPVQPTATIEEVHAVARRWLGPEFDLTVIDAVLAATAAHRLDNGIPVWIVIVSGSGAAKTECVEMLEGAGARVESKIKGEAAFLSASPHRERSKISTGGLLVEIGETGILGLKDMTSVLGMNRTARDEVLAALREIHDGRWSRLVGVDGGRRVSWAGRITVITACTSAWDRAHEVLAAMGDRFVIIRLDSRYGRREAFDQAIRNAGHEPQMKRELAGVAGGLLSGLDASRIEALSPSDLDAVFEVANVVTLCRGGVNTDYQLNVIETGAPELATRFGKQLLQLIRGAMALGMVKPDAVMLAIRAARDSMAPLRLEVLMDLNEHAGVTAATLWQRLDRPRNTVQRCLDALVDMRCITSHVDQGERRYYIQTDMVKGITAMAKIGKGTE